MCLLKHIINRGLVLLQVLCIIYAFFSGESYAFKIERNKMLRTDSFFFPYEMSENIQLFPLPSSLHKRVHNGEQCLRNEQSQAPAELPSKHCSSQTVGQFKIHLVNRYLYVASLMCLMVEF